MADDVIEIRRDETVWRFEREFLESNWVCLYGNGCKGILPEPAAELGQGCCSLGADIGDGPAGENEAMTVAAYATVLSPDHWQLYDVAHADSDRDGVIGIFRDDQRSHTRVVDGACIFLNRPGFSDGVGFACTSPHSPPTSHPRTGNHRSVGSFRCASTGTTLTPTPSRRRFGVRHAPTGASTASGWRGAARNGHTAERPSQGPSG